MDVALDAMPAATIPLVTTQTRGYHAMPYTVAECGECSYLVGLALDQGDVIHLCYVYRYWHRVRTASTRSQETVSVKLCRNRKLGTVHGCNLEVHRACLCTVRVKYMELVSRDPTR